MIYANWKTGQLGLPFSGTLSNGKTVSSYNKLPATALEAEGWLQAETFEPDYDPETQTLEISTIEKVDKVIDGYTDPETGEEVPQTIQVVSKVTYVAVDKPPQAPTYEELVAEVLELGGTV